MPCPSAFQLSYNRETRNGLPEPTDYVVTHQIIRVLQQDYLYSRETFSNHQEYMKSWPAQQLLPKAYIINPYWQTDKEVQIPFSISAVMERFYYKMQAQVFICAKDTKLFR